MKHILKTVLSLILILALAVPVCLAETADAAKIDYHKCSQLLIDVFGERCVDEACQVIDAFLAGESSVYLDNYVLGDMSAISNIVGDMCPLMDGLVWLGWDYFDDETKTYHWTNLVSYDELNSYRERFEKVSLEYLDKLQPTDTDLVKYLSLYYDYISPRTYNYDLQEELNACEKPEDQAYISSALRAMIDYTGTCITFSECYTFLCIQANLNAIGVGNQVSDTGAHEWNVIQIDGKYYYADTTWDLPDSSGYPSLMHFGMTAEERSWDGYELEDTTFGTNYPLIELSSLGLDDDRFVLMHGWSYGDITAFSVDHAKNTVTVTNIDGYTSEIK